METKLIRLALADLDPVTRIVGLAALPDAADNAWLRDYFSSESRDIESALAEVRARLGGLEVDVLLTPYRCDDADVIVTRRASIDSGLITRCRHLRLIQRLGRWPRGIDVQAAHDAGIHVSCLPRRTLALTAEHAVLLMLATGKQLHRAQDKMAEEWVAPHSRPMDGVSYNWVGLSDLRGLHGETIGLVGFGDVASETALCLQGFSADVWYWSRHRAPKEMEMKCSVRWCELDALLASARYVSLHLPLTTDTVGWMCMERFRQMSTDAFFINTSRGQLVDEDALYEALVSGLIAGAGLDVHATEPCGWDRLRQLPNVVASPHIAGGSRYGVLDEAKTVMDNLVAIARGDEPKFLC